MKLDANFMNRSLIDHARSGVIVWAVSTFCLFYLYRADVAALSLRTLVWFVAGLFGAGLGLGVLSYMVGEIVLFFAGLAVKTVGAVAPIDEAAAGKILAAFSVVSFAIFALLSFLLVKKAFLSYLSPL